MTSSRLSVAEYDVAIAAIESSTKALQDHQIVLKSVLSSLPESKASQHTLTTQPLFKNTHSVADHALAVSSAYEVATGSLQSAIIDTLKNIHTQIEAHDTIFNQLNDRDNKLQNLVKQQKADHDRTQQLQESLHNTERDLIATRLNRIYFETLLANQPPNDSTNTQSLLHSNSEQRLPLRYTFGDRTEHGHDSPNHATPTITTVESDPAAEIQAIKSDIATLQAEISPVLTLAHEHTQGSLRTQTDDQIIASTSYLQLTHEHAVSRCLESMNNELERFVQQSDELSSLRALYTRIGDLMEREVEDVEKFMERESTGTSKAVSVRANGSNTTDRGILGDLARYFDLPTSREGPGSKTMREKQIARFEQFKGASMQVVDEQKRQIGLLESAFGRGDTLAESLDELDVEIGSVREELERTQSQE